MKNNLINRVLHIAVLSIFLVNQSSEAALALSCHVGTSIYGGTVLGETTTKTDAEKEGLWESFRNALFGADPVLIHNGEFVLNAQDLMIPSRGLPLIVSRVYRNQREFNGPFGYGWFFNFQIRVVKLENNNIVLIDGGRGRKDEFIYNSGGGGSYTAPAGIYDSLQQNPDGTYTWISKHGMKMNFNIDGYLSTMADRNGNALTFTYGTQPLPVIAKSLYFPSPINGVVLFHFPLLSIKDATGRSINFSYNPNGRLSKIVDFSGREIIYTYDTRHDLVSVKDAMGFETKYSYDSKHNLQTITDPKGQVYLSNVYDDKDRIFTQKEGDGVYKFNYDPATKQTTLTDRKGFVTKTTFNADELPIKVEKFTKGMRATDPSAFITEYIYNGQHEIQQITLPKKNSIAYSYDTKGNVTQVLLKPDPQTVPLPPDISARFTYEPNFNFIKTITDPKGQITTFTYDYELPSTDPQYGTKGNLIKIELPLVNGVRPSAKYAYNAFGQLVQQTDSNGNVTTFSYDPNTGYLKGTIQDPNGLKAISTLKYDSVGNVLFVQDANNHETKNVFNANNWLIQTTDPLGFVTKYTYDRNGNIEKVEKQADLTGTVWQTLSMTYTKLDKLQTITDPLNRVTAYTYDLNENLNTVKDFAGALTTYVYDERDLLFKTIDANVPAATTQYDYDPNGNLIKILDAKKNPTMYIYDAFDRMVKRIYADNRADIYELDDNSNLFRYTAPTGKKTEFDYDVLNRVTAKRFVQDPGLNTTYLYDPGSRLIKATIADSQLDFVFDALSRVKQTTQKVGGQSYTFKYSYDLAGNRKQLIYPSTKTIDYVYDDNDQLTSMNVDSVALANYAYDPLHRRTQKNIATSTPQQSVYAYDMGNQLASVQNRLSAGTNISKYEYPLYDPVGNAKQRNRIFKTNAIETLNYTYNKVYQLTGVSGVQTQNYTYDSLGNRVTANGITYQANNLNQYSKVGTVSPGYDLNGNLISDGKNTYTYDPDNRLASIKNTQTTTYKYDAFNRRISRNVNGAITYFLYDGDDLVAEINAAGTKMAEYVHGPGVDEVLLMERNGQKYYYQYDGQGSVTEITNPTGVIVENYIYDAYGKPTMYGSTGQVMTGSAIKNPYMYTGRQWDEESGIYHYRARMYDPNLGRFLQRDPLGYWDSLNLYEFVGGNPINWRDPFGLEKYNGLLWYDRLALWTALVLGSGKDLIFSGVEPNAFSILGAILAASVADLILGTLYLPSSIGHLGEGTGYFIANPSLQTAPGMLMDVSLVATILAGGSGAIGRGEINASSSSTVKPGSFGPKLNSEAGFVRIRNTDAAAMRRLSGGEIKILKNNGIDVHDLKPNSKYDLFKDKKGEIFYKPKNGAGPGETTGINIHDFE